MTIRCVEFLAIPMKREDGHQISDELSYGPRGGGTGWVALDATGVPWHKRPHLHKSQSTHRIETPTFLTHSTSWPNSNAGPIAAQPDRRGDPFVNPSARLIRQLNNPIPPSWRSAVMLGNSKGQKVLGLIARWHLVQVAVRPGPQLRLDRTGRLSLARSPR